MKNSIIRIICALSLAIISSMMAEHTDEINTKTYQLNITKDSPIMHEITDEIIKCIEKSRDLYLNSYNPFVKVCYSMIDVSLRTALSFGLPETDCCMDILMKFCCQSYILQNQQCSSPLNKSYAYDILIDNANNSQISGAISRNANMIINVILNHGYRRCITKLLQTSGLPNKHENVCSAILSLLMRGTGDIYTSIESLKDTTEQYYEQSYLLGRSSLIAELSKEDFIKIYYDCLDMLVRVYNNNVLREN